MKIVSWTTEAGEVRYGSWEHSLVRVLRGEWSGFEPTDELIDAESIEFGVPVRPRNIVCVGLNYLLHAEEAGLPVPEQPALFTKLTSSLAATGDVIVKPAATTKLDYEVELGVVIGTAARNVSVDDALQHVAGYIAVNDVSARDLQRGDAFGWVRGKSADTFCPVGRCVVTADEIADPQSMGLRTMVNGETRQDSTTADMIFTVAQIISFISTTVTLQPGDLICTGTPSGVADGMNPPVYLQPGDYVVVEIDRLGSVENLVVAEKSLA